MKKIIEGNKYQIVISLIIIITLVFGFSYALFSSAVEKSNALTIIAGDFSYKITGTGVDPSGIYTLAPNTSKEYTLTIESLSNIESEYQMYYKVLEGDDPTKEEVGYTKDTIKNPHGTIKGKEIITMKLIVENKQATNLKVLVGIQGGLVGKTLTLKEGSKISDQKSLENILVRGKESYDGLSGYFWDYKKDITRLTFSNKINPPASPVQTWDLSVKNDNAIVGYLTGNTSSGYTLYIQSNGIIYANPNSSSFLTLFVRLTTIDGLENFNTSNVLNMSNMFNSCGALSLNLSTFDTSNVTDMYSMFGDCGNLKNLDLSNFDTSNVVNISFMFSGCRSLSNLNISSFRMQSAKHMNNMFSDCSSLTTLNLDKFDTSGVINMANMFSNCTGLTSLNLSLFTFSSVTFSNDMFMSVPYITVITVKGVTEQEWVIGKGTDFSTYNVIIG